MLRISHDRKIDEIAKSSGFSPAYISQLENGRKTLNYRSLRRILLNGFGETLSSFLAKIMDAENNSFRILESSVKIPGDQNNIIVEIPVPVNTSNCPEIVKLTLFPGAVFDEEYKTSFKVSGYVLTGRVQFETDEKFEFASGAGFFYNGSNFKIINPGRENAEVILSFTPPVF